MRMTPQEMAREKNILNRFRVRGWRYSLSSNPFNGNRDKKLRAKWYNEFRDECKIIGRNPYSVF